MSKKPATQVIGVTTDKARIHEMLSVSSSSVALFEATPMGEYYAEQNHDGTFVQKSDGTIRLVRVISAEQADFLESEVCRLIDDASQQLQNITRTHKVLLENLYENLSNDFQMPKLVFTGCTSPAGVDFANPISIDHAKLNKHMDKILKDVRNTSRTMAVETAKIRRKLG